MTFLIEKKVVNNSIVYLTASLILILLKGSSFILDRFDPSPKGGEVVYGKLFRMKPRQTILNTTLELFLLSFTLLSMLNLTLMTKKNSWQY